MSIATLGKEGKERRLVKALPREELAGLRCQPYFLLAAACPASAHRQVSRSSSGAPASPAKAAVGKQPSSFLLPAEQF